MALYQGSAGMDEYYGKICEYILPKFHNRFTCIALL